MSTLAMLLAGLHRVLGADPHGVLHRVATAQLELERTASRLKIASLGNLGSHDNPSTPGALRSALATLEGFDRTARSLQDALPEFLYFVRSETQPNHPFRATFEPVASMGTGRSGTTRHIFTRAWNLDGARVYSATDVTQNHVSLNPVLLDWTEWLAREER